MEKEQQAEWLNFQQAARALVKTGIQAKWKKRLLQLLILPTFEPRLSYEIYEQGSMKQPVFMVASSCWRWDLDVIKFTNPVERLKHPYPLHPTIEESAVEITAEFAQAILDKFRMISVPVLSDEGGIGLDGTTYEIKLGAGLQSSRFSWWNQAPIEWRPLEIAFHETVTLLEQVLRKNS